MMEATLYWQLVHSHTVLAHLRNTLTLEDFCQQLRIFWQQPDISNDRLLKILRLGNSQYIWPDSTIFCAFWSPAEYDSKQRVLTWIPGKDKPLLPFYSEHICMLRGQLLAALIQPKTLLSDIVNFSKQLPKVQPSGFIFHLSRCGSTLVSRSYARLERCRVLSESPLLTQLLLDPTLDVEQKSVALKLCINLQGRLYGEEQHLIIKWNAWDLQFWPQIRMLYPEVPVLLLIRNPVEIMASQQKLTGFHMVRHLMSGWFPELQMLSANTSIFSYQCAVLRLLLQHSVNVSGQNGVMILDYKNLLPAISVDVAAWFSLNLSLEEIQILTQSQKLHSKGLNQIFVPDTQEKQHFFSAQQKQQILNSCEQLYSLFK